MKNFLIFFSIVLVIYAAINYYIFIRGYQSIPRESSLRTFYIFFFIFLASSYFIGRILEKYTLSIVSEFFMWVGAFWLAIMVYLFLSVLLLDLLRLTDHFTGIFPDYIKDNYSFVKQITAILVIGVTLTAVAAGRVNAVNPRVKKLSLRLEKSFNDGRPVRVFMASDVHLGTLISNSRLDHLIDQINAYNPDVVLFAGDLFDEDLGPVIKDNLGDQLKQIRSRYGVYAIMGNHEYYGGVSAATRYMEDHGITVLRDKTVKVNNSFYLIGREDLTRNQVEKRATLEKLTEQLDRSLPWVLMDHQPYHLEEAEKNQVDLQLSGHTHHGQLWPFNYITELVYEVSWGYKLKGNTHVYVSSGFGGWGPPIRLGNRPEVVEIELIPGK